MILDEEIGCKYINIDGEQVEGNVISVTELDYEGDNGILLCVVQATLVRSVETKLKL